MMDEISNSLSNSHLETIEKWITQKKKEGYFKGDVFYAYQNNLELQNIWENCKDNYDDQLPERVKECYLFTEAEDLNNFTNYWRSKGLVRISGAIIHVDKRTIEEAIQKYFYDEMAQAKTNVCNVCKVCNVCNVCNV